MNTQKCQHAASGCNYPEGECAELCKTAMGKGVVLYGNEISTIVKLAFDTAYARDRKYSLIALGENFREQLINALVSNVKTVIMTGRPTKSELALLASAVNVATHILFIVICTCNVTWVPRAGCQFEVKEIK